jgi:hypothetical protein
VVTDALDSAFTTGVVSWYTVKHGTQPAVPVCASPGTYKLNVVTDGLHTHVTAEPALPDVKQKMRVYDGFGWSINVRGMPTCPVLTMMPLIRVQREMVKKKSET